MSRDARAKISAAVGNLRIARWYAGEGNKATEAAAHLVDAGLFLGLAIAAGATTKDAAWARAMRCAHRAGSLTTERVA